MSNDEIILRPYQSENIFKSTRLIKQDRIVGLAAAVGSGKTLMSKCIIHNLYKMGFKKVVIATPLLNIGKDFETDVDTLYKHDSSVDGIARGSYLIKEGHFIFVDDRRVSTIKNLIVGDVGANPHIITHHTLARLERFFKKLDGDLSDTAIIVDEAHHCSDHEEDSTKIGNVISKARTLGAAVIYMTATPYRIFNEIPICILPDDCNVVVRTVGEQIREKYSPKVKIDFVKLREGALIDDGKETISCNGNSHFSSNAAVNESKELVFDRWEKCGYPKSILIIPPGDSEGVSKKLVKYFESKEFNSKKVVSKRGRKNPRILNAVGLGKDEIIEEIKLDKLKNGREYDMVIACKRCDEGTDIPSASHIFSIGIPGNIRLINQRIGRILRNKNEVVGYDGYFGKRHSKTSVMTYFLPSYGDIKNFDKQAANQLLHCVLVGEEYEKYCKEIPFIEKLRIKVKKEAKKGKKKEKTLDIIDNLVNAAEIDMPFVEKGILIEVLKAGNVRVGDIPKILDEIDFDNHDETSVLINVMDIVGLSEKDKNKFVEKTFKKIMEIPPSVKNVNKAVKDVFEEVVNEFNDKLLKMKSSKKVNELSYILTGKDMKYWCDEFFENLEDRLMKILKDEKVHGIVNQKMTEI